MMGRTSAVGNVLVASVRGDLGSAQRAAERLGEQSDQLVSAATFHGVEAFVHGLLGADERLPHGVREALRDEYYRVVLTRQQVLADLSLICETLQRAAVDFVVLKGPSLAERLYADPLLRSYRDLDLLVRPEDLPRSVEALEASGHQMLDANWDLLLEVRPGEVHLMAPGGTVVDLHWHLLNDERVRARFSIDTDDVVGRSEQTVIGTSGARVLDPVDQLVYVALHACRSGGDRLIWLQDIALCARSELLDKPAVWRRAEQWRVRTAIAVVLARAERVLGGIDPQLRLHRNGYERFDAAVTRLTPIPNATGRRSAVRFLANAACDRPVESVGLLTGNALGWVRRGAPTGVADLVERDPSSDTSPLHPTGGSDGRDRFLAAVATNRM